MKCDLAVWLEEYAANLQGFRSDPGIKGVFEEAAVIADRMIPWTSMWNSEHPVKTRRQAIEQLIHLSESLLRQYATKELKQVKRLTHLPIDHPFGQFVREARLLLKATLMLAE